MGDQNIPALISHPASDAFAQSAARFASQMRGGTGPSGAGSAEQARTAAREFESLFVAYLLKVMRETIEESGLSEGGPGKSLYTELFDQELARAIAQRGAFGVSDMLINQYARTDGAGKSTEDNGTSKAGSSPGSLPDPPPPEDREEEEIPDFLLPVRAPVSSSYGSRRDPFTSQVRFHKGIDLAAPRGTEVIAALGGQVVSAGYESGYGNTVVVQHEKGYQTRYAHLETVGVRAGDALQIGQSLGTVGSTGRSTGPHLHFEVTQWGASINPKSAMTD